ncbi:hypothetical protein BABINDRAFT_160477 [Babjeviella inositovora NRRL Y-12698]|uniref:F-box domain-containing protein n=1 Tax=Babjeviella inositovora NRRL Y-12698 TaxID=984486 RepID=A0A1E3QTQ0_9ASCO|nr:uncharacterized protein BABINDRAFT_160477 [Babjeviella inositovora NRRL Y-12698]ODQ81061.1 hypothetical protein BABINDRAFT_160477 [Babjeviella inositovora NRRL Y-12698]
MINLHGFADLPSDIISQVFRYLPVDLIRPFLDVPCTHDEAHYRLFSDVMVNPYRADTTNMSCSLSFPTFWGLLEDTHFGNLELIIEHIEEFTRTVERLELINKHVANLSLYIEVHLSDFNKLAHTFQHFSNLTKLSLKLNNGAERGTIDLARLVLPPSLTLLDLSSNSQSVDSFQGLFIPETLQKLNLSQNSISMAASLCNFPPTLRVLDLSENNIQDLRILKLPENLENLNLFNNRVAEIPANFRFPRGLQHLNLSRNKLTRLAGELKDLCNLQDLRLVTQNTGGASLNIDDLELPANLEKLAFCNEEEDIGIFSKLPRQLKHLYLSFNPFRRLPKNLTDFTRLETLSLGFTELYDIDSVKFPASLKELNLTLNLIIRVPRHLSELPNLRELNLSKNSIFSISNCKFGEKLSTLLLDGNQITRLPKVLRNNANLRSLNVSGNPLAAHELFDRLPSRLETLDASGVEFSSEIRFPERLKSLTLRNCGIHSLVDVHLPQFIEYLDVSQNLISEIPAQMTLPRTLKTLIMKQNQFALETKDEILDRFADISISLDNEVMGQGNIEGMTESYEEGVRDDELFTEDIVEEL